MKSFTLLSHEVFSSSFRVHAMMRRRFRPLPLLLLLLACLAVAAVGEGAGGLARRTGAHSEDPGEGNLRPTQGWDESEEDAADAERGCAFGGGWKKGLAQRGRGRGRRGTISAKYLRRRPSRWAVEKPPFPPPLRPLISPLYALSLARASR